MIFKGKTIEEALITAEKETGRKREEFNYKVIEKKQGLFKGKEYEIEVTGLKEIGKLEIKNGRVIYHRGDIRPSITPGDNVVIKINNAIIASRTYVKEEDEIIIEALNSSQERSAVIEVSQDKLAAYIDVKYTPERTFEVIDREPDQDIVVEVKAIKCSMPDLYSKNDIEEMLSSNKIKYGISWQNISEVVKGGRHIIAEGLKPEAPENDIIKYFFNYDKDKKPLEINGKVDYYSIGKIETVEAGDLLALREPGKDGKPGCDVFGIMIPPAKKEVLKIKKGPGVDLLDSGNKAVALIKGMVSIKNDAICVFPVHSVNGDVDLKTGNIEFDGDIVITRDIKEGFKVSSGNNLTVYGSAAGAEINSGGSIKIEKNIISSTLKAGEKQLNDLKGLELIKVYYEFLDYAVNTYGELQKSGKLNENLNISIFLKVILDSKFKGTRDKIYEGIDFISKNKIREDIVNLWQDGVKLLRRMDEGSITDIKVAITLKHFLKEFIEKYDIISTPADVILNYSQNSNIFATNNVEVKGKGCYNTNITADNRIIFTGYPGIVRGGQLIARNGIAVKEVGSSAGVVTVLKTSKSGTVEAAVAYQNTIICVEEQIYRIDYPVKNLKAYMDKGDIVVEKLKL